MKKMTAPHSWVNEKEVICLIKEVATNAIICDRLLSLGVSPNALIDDHGNRKRLAEQKAVVAGVIRGRKDADEPNRP